jgi:hypothetical protein
MNRQQSTSISRKHLPENRKNAEGEPAESAPCFSAFLISRVGTARRSQACADCVNLSACAVAVGMLIAEHPPHRSGRAAFPHTAPTSDV